MEPMALIIVRIFGRLLVQPLIEITASSSREAHAKQKVLAQERKASKPNADSIARAKKLWERLRRKSHVPLVERKTLVAELFDIITGRIKDFVLKHDSVRVVQTAEKYANVDQRKMIAQELKGEYRGLAESRYAKFLIGKLLVHGDEEIRDMVVPEFYGHVQRLIRHPEASWILDDIYRGAATQTQKAILLREWYGAEFALFKPDSKDVISAELQKILDEHPEKRSPIMRSLHGTINQLVQKKTTGFTMLHDAMLQYFLNIQPGSEEMTDFIELLKGDEEGDLLKNLAFTRSGARLVCLCLAYGNAKDRKQILKVYKGTMSMLAYDTHGHQLLLATYDVIDDTVLTAKSIFPELLGKDPGSEDQHTIMLDYIMNLNARIPLLYLFAGKAKFLLSEDDMNLLDEIHTIRSSHSKKDPELRRSELLISLSPYLLNIIAAKADTLIQSSFGCQLITEVLLNSIDNRTPAMTAIANLTQGSPETKAHLDTPAAGRMLKHLVMGGHFNSKTMRIDVKLSLGFDDILYSKISDDIVAWATGCNSFVVLGMLEANNFSHRLELIPRLKEERGRLEEAAKGMDGGVTQGVKKKERVQSGNSGAKLILKILDNA